MTVIDLAEARTRRRPRPTIVRDAPAPVLNLGHRPFLRQHLRNQATYSAAVDTDGIGHSPFCATVDGAECSCTSCHCVTFQPGGELGTCGRCHRPLIVGGKVVRN